MSREPARRARRRLVPGGSKAGHWSHRSQPVEAWQERRLAARLRPPPAPVLRAAASVPSRVPAARENRRPLPGVTACRTTRPMFRRQTVQRREDGEHWRAVHGRAPRWSQRQAVADRIRGTTTTSIRRQIRRRLQSEKGGRLARSDLRSGVCPGRAAGAVDPTKERHWRQFASSGWGCPLTEDARALQAVARR